MPDKGEFETVLLAALLHDIGKLWQRTSQPLEDRYRSLCSETAKHHSFQACPTCASEFGYAHAVLAWSFITDYLGKDHSAAASVASAHHRAQNAGLPSRIVQLADRLSSVERSEHEEGAPPVKQLVSTFSRVYDQKGEQYFPLRPLSLDRDTLFPGKARDPGERESYSALWSGFLSEMARVKELFDAGFYTGFNSLYYLLQKYTWCVPSAYHRDVPDVSLFDHLRTTCAIAASLYRSGISGEDVDSLLNGRASNGLQKKPFMSLVGGDVSGVQRFLYTQTSKGVARGLRGRSFYLELLTEVAAYWLLRRLDLPITNLLYDGGGHFYVLAPYLEEARIQQLRHDLALPFLDWHHGDLYLALAKLDLSAADLKPENFGSKWSEIIAELGAVKRRRFQELDAVEIHEKVFSPRGTGDPADTCAVCREEGAHNTREDGERVCDLCHDLEDLGRGLADARFLLIAPLGKKSPKSTVPHWQRLFRDLGFHVTLKRELLPGTVESPGPGALLLRLNSTDFLGEDAMPVPGALEHPPAPGFRFLAQATPRSLETPGEIADFESLAGASEGVQRIGILRMDVDNLGSLFREGLTGNATISRVSSVSFLLRLFFEGWLNQLCAGFNLQSLGKGGKDQVYAIYSGGDDLFIAGAWSAIPEVANCIHEDFSDFTCHNPRVHISAGVTVDSPHAPLYQLAQAAHESLDGRAKEYRAGDQQKNAIDFLERTMAWDEMDAVRKLCDALVGMIAGDGALGGKAAPRALLHLLMTLHTRYDKAVGAAGRPQTAGKGPSMYYGPWMWQAAYFLGRMIERMGDPAHPELARLKGSLTDPKELAVALPRAALAARWAELLTRQEEPERRTRWDQ